MKKDEVIKNNIKLITNLKKNHIPVKPATTTIHAPAPEQDLMVPQRDCLTTKELKPHATD